MSERRCERGAASVEMVLVTPVLVALLLFVVAVGRLAEAKGEVSVASRDGARAAANARSVSGAHRAAHEAALAALADRGVACRNLSVAVDTSEFRADGSVKVTVHCEVELQSAAGVGLPMTRTLTSTFVSPVDRYRGASS